MFVIVPPLVSSLAAGWPEDSRVGRAGADSGQGHAGGPAGEQTQLRSQALQAHISQYYWGPSDKMPSAGETTWSTPGR